MRQWEMIGITDRDPFEGEDVERPSEREVDDLAVAEQREFFWATDSALRIQVVSEAALEVTGWPSGRCLGRDLVSLFGILGPNLGVVSAHIAALGGGSEIFTLEGARATVRCWVGPVHDQRGNVTGTRCLATGIETIDVRDALPRSAVA